MSQVRAVADNLTADAPLKPLDLGNGRVAASFGSDGSWLSLGTPHPTLGFVEMSGAPTFDEAWRGDPHAVRRYRGWLTEDRYAFLRLDMPQEEVSGRRVAVDDEGRPVWRRSGRGWSLSATAWALPDSRILVQRYVIEAAPGVRGILRFSGRIDRCALAEITEVNPPSPVEVHPEAHLRGRELTVATPELETSAVVTVEGPAGHWVVGGSDDTLLSEIEAGPGTSGPVEVTITVSLDSPVWPGDPQRTPTVTAPRIAPGDAADGLAGVTTGALRYILGCTAFDVGGGDRAILTDHRLLPLSWTRDAYYQALLLLCAAPDDRAVTDVVQGHLRWLWGRGRAPGTPWMRSHLPDGRPKDLAIQADQQLYPLLELADYRRVTGRWPVPPVGGDAEPVKRWGELIEEVWRSLPRQGESGLLADAENPADDPSELPFTLSTQILYWHTAIQLAPYATELGLAALHLESTAQDLRIAVRRAFTCEGPYGPQWAYETDGAGHHRLYHDANDLPTAFAPSWGFCSSGDRQWAATMRFAFSEHNPAYVSGLHGGLGSAHTLGTWPLGDAQELAVAITTGDKDRATAVRCRVNRVAAVDGLLPETYDPETGDWLARHWFAWPAAVFGVLHLGIKLG